MPRVGAEEPRPEAVTEDHHLIAPGLVLGRGEGTAERRGDAEDVEEAGAGTDTDDAFGPFVARQCHGRGG